MADLIGIDVWRRWVARLALLLTLFAVLQPALAASMRPGSYRYVDFPVRATADTRSPHDHEHVVCHSCPGHICLEQHGRIDLTPQALISQPGEVETWEPPEAPVLWPHPPTAPPSRRIALRSQPRAPPATA